MGGGSSKKRKKNNEEKLDEIQVQIRMLEKEEEERQEQARLDALAQEQSEDVPEPEPEPEPEPDAEAAEKRNRKSNYLSAIKKPPPKPPPVSRPTYKRMREEEEIHNSLRFQQVAKIARHAMGSYLPKRKSAQVVSLQEALRLGKDDETEGEEYKGSKQRPAWFQSALEETVQTSEWMHIEKDVDAAIKAFIDKTGTTTQISQCLYELVGEDFVARYFPNAKTDPALLEPPLMQRNVRDALHQQYMKELHAVVHRALESTHKEKAVDKFIQATYDIMQAAIWRTVNGKLSRSQQAEGLDPYTAIERKAGASARGMVHLAVVHPQLGHRLARFMGCSLPLALRQYVWALSLVDHKGAYKVAEDVKVRLRHWGLSSTSCAVSPIRGLLERLVNNVRVFLRVDSDYDPVRLQDLLSYYYFATEKYGFVEAVMGYQLLKNFPIMSIEEVACMLVHAKNLPALSPKGTAAIAQQALAALEHHDEELYKHLVKVFTNALPTGAKKGSEVVVKVVSPEDLIQRWVKHLFVGFLSDDNSAFVWDQIFMHGQSRMGDIIVCACSVILRLIGPQLLFCHKPETLDKKSTLAPLFISFGELQSLLRPLLPGGGNGVLLLSDDDDNDDEDGG